MRLNEYLEKADKWAILTIGIIVTLMMGIIDYFTGTEVSFAIFYVLPISFVTWYGNKNQGLALSLLSTALWVNADMVQLDRYSSPVMPFINGFVRFGLFAIIVVLISSSKELRKALEVQVKERTKELLEVINEHKKTELQLKKQSEKLRQLAIRFQNMREEENEGMAREIHDELGQALTAIKMETVSLSKKYSNSRELVERLIIVVDIVDETIKTVREISKRLRPRLLDQLGLIPALEWHIKDFQSRTGISCTLNIPEENIKLSPHTSIALFRIFQEAMTNVVRHSKATCVGIKINCINGSLLLNVKDNGVGINNDYIDKAQSLGILGMKERARLVGGLAEVMKAEEGGTEVAVNIPLKKN